MKLNDVNFSTIDECNEAIKMIADEVMERLNIEPPYDPDEESDDASAETTDLPVSKLKYQFADPSGMTVVNLEEKYKHELKVERLKIFGKVLTSIITIGGTYLANKSKNDQINTILMSNMDDYSKRELLNNIYPKGFFRTLLKM